LNEQEYPGEDLMLGRCGDSLECLLVMHPMDYGISYAYITLSNTAVLGTGLWRAITIVWEGAYEKALLLTGGVGGVVKERMTLQASSLNVGISSKNK